MVTKEIEIPSWFESGVKFKSKWITNGNNTCTLISFDRVTNLAEVEIEANGSTWTEDGWNLQHTIWGFEKGDYSIIE